jgi:hypothetical protein
MSDIEHIARTYGASSALMVACLRHRFSDVVLPDADCRALASLTSPDIFSSDNEAHQFAPAALFHPSITSSVPPVWLKQFQRLHQGIATRTLAGIVEIQALNDALEKAGFDVRFWKGPLLSYLLYGNLTTRPTRDFDIMVRPDELIPIRHLLLSLGYADEQPLRASVIPVYLRTHREWVMHRKAENGLKYYVELQLAPAMPWSISKQTAAMAFSSRNLVALGSSRIPVPDLETHWLMLAAHHGYSEGWRQLSQVSDMAAFASLPEGRVDADRLLRLSELFGLKRVITIGLGLAQELTGVNVPSNFIPLVQQEQRMIQRLTARLLSHPMPSKSEESLDAMRLQWAMAENIPARVRLLSGHLRKWLLPGYFELANIRLSSPFGFLYTPLKLARPLIRRFFAPPHPGGS